MSAPKFKAAPGIPGGVVLYGNGDFLTMLIDLVAQAASCDEIGTAEHALRKALEAVREENRRAEEERKKKAGKKPPVRRGAK